MAGSGTNAGETPDKHSLVGHDKPSETRSFAIVAHRGADDSLSAPTRSSCLEVPALTLLEPQEYRDHLSSQRQITHDHGEVSLVQEQNTIAARVEPASIWEGYLIHGLSSGRASPEARADLKKHALQFYEKHCGDKLYDFSKITELTDELWRCDRLDDAEELNRLNIELAEQSVGSAHVYTLELRGDLARTLKSQGKYIDAERLELDVVSLLERQLGDNDERTLQYQTDLGHTYMELGRLKEAEIIFHDVVKRASTVLDDRHEVTLFAKQNLGETLMLLRSYDKALQELREVAKAREILFGFADAKTLKTYIILASLTQLAGHFDEAESLNKRISLEILKSSYPPTLLWTLESKENEAGLLLRLGQVVQADNLLRSLVYEKTNLFSARHPKTIQSKAMLANSLYYQYRFRDATKLGREILSACEETLGPHNRSTLTAKANLAWYQEDCLTLREFGSKMQEVLKLRRTVLGEDDPHTLDSNVFMAEIYSRRGNWKGFEQFFTRLQQKQKEIYGTEKHPEFVDGLISYARILRENGEYSKSEKAQRRALALREGLYGHRHPETLKLVKGLVYTLLALGQFENAKSLLSDGLSGLRDAVGSKHPLTINLLVAQAYLTEEEGRWSDAEIICKAILNFWETYGSDHPFSIFAKMKVAWSCQQQYKFSDAEKLYSSALEDAKASFGSQHREVAKILVKLASLRIAQGNLGEASVLYDTTLEITRARLCGFDAAAIRNTLVNFSAMASSGFASNKDPHQDICSMRGRNSDSDDRDSLNIIAHLACLRTKENRLNEAERLYKEVSDKMRILLGEEHEDTLSAFSNLAWLYAEQGKVSASKELYEMVLKRRTEALGDAHPNTLNAMSDLACYHTSREEWDAAEALYRKVLERWRDGFGDRHFQTIAAKEDLAYALKSRYQFAESYSLYQEILDWRKSNLGRDHRETAFTIRDIARLQVSQCLFTAAENYFRLALQILQKIGATYGDVVSVMCDLAESYQGQGKHKEAESEWERGLRLAIDHLCDTHPTVRIARRGLAASKISLGKLKDAEEIIKELLKFEESNSSRDSHRVIELKTMLGDALIDQGKSQDCEDLIESAIRLSQDVSCMENPVFFAAAERLALAKRRCGKLDEAEVLQRSLLQNRIHYFGEVSYPVEESLQQLMLIMSENSRYSDAEHFGELALWIRVRLSSELDTSTLPLIHDLANLKFTNGKYDESEAMLRTVCISYGSAANVTIRDFSRALSTLADLKLTLNKPSEAKPLLEHAIDLERTIWGNEIGLSHPSFSTDEQCCQEGGGHAAVTPRHISGKDKNPHRLLRIFKLLIRTEQSLGNLENAEFLQKQMLSAMESEGRTECKHYVLNMLELTKTYRTSGKYDEAEALCQRAISEAKRILGECHSLVLDCITHLAMTKLLRGQTAEAEALQEHIVDISQQHAVQDKSHYVGALMNLIFVKALAGKWQDCTELVLEWAAATAMSSGKDRTNPAWIIRRLTPQDKTLLKLSLQREDVLEAKFGANRTGAVSIVEKALSLFEASD